MNPHCLQRGDRSGHLKGPLFARKFEGHWLVGQLGLQARLVVGQLRCFDKDLPLDQPFPKTL